MPVYVPLKLLFCIPLLFTYCGGGVVGTEIDHLLYPLLTDILAANRIAEVRNAHAKYIYKYTVPTFYNNIFTLFRKLYVYFMIHINIVMTINRT
jgi:hypothetical protein